MQVVRCSCGAPSPLLRSGSWVMSSMLARRGRTMRRSQLAASEDSQHTGVCVCLGGGALPRGRWHFGGWEGGWGPRVWTWGRVGAGGLHTPSPLHMPAPLTCNCLPPSPAGPHGTRLCGVRRRRTTQGRGSSACTAARGQGSASLVCVCGGGRGGAEGGLKHGEGGGGGEAEGGLNWGGGG